MLNDYSNNALLWNFFQVQLHPEWEVDILFCLKKNGGGGGKVVKKELHKITSLRGAKLGHNICDLSY